MRLRPSTRRGPVEVPITGRRGDFAGMSPRLISVHPDRSKFLRPRESRSGLAAPPRRAPSFVSRPLDARNVALPNTDRWHRSGRHRRHLRSPSMATAARVYENISGSCSAPCSARSALSASEQEFAAAAKPVTGSHGRDVDLGAVNADAVGARARVQPQMREITTTRAFHQRKSRGPSNAPAKAHSAIVPPYQSATNGSESSVQ
jgi:hypothetical protein